MVSVQAEQDNLAAVLAEQDIFEFRAEQERLAAVQAEQDRLAEEKRVEEEEAKAKLAEKEMIASQEDKKREKKERQKMQRDEEKKRKGSENSESRSTNTSLKSSPVKASSQVDRALSPGEQKRLGLPGGLVALGSGTSSSASYKVRTDLNDSEKFQHTDHEIPNLSYSALTPKSSPQIKSKVSKENRTGI